MALYPDLVVLEGSIRKLESETPKTDTYNEIRENIESDSEDDFDYVLETRLDGDKENQGILPPAPFLPQKQTPKLPTKVTSAVYSVPPVPYATVAARKNYQQNRGALNSHSAAPDLRTPGGQQTDKVEYRQQNERLNEATAPTLPPRAPIPAPRVNTKQSSPEPGASASSNIREAHFQDEDMYGTKAPGKQAIIQWFNKTKSTTLQDQSTSIIPSWFHGLITRDEAEFRLQNEPVGCFLMRFSETRFGYSLSIRAEDRIRHYMIDKDKSKRKYLIVNETLMFNTLRDLVEYYKKNKVSTWDGKLTKACGEGDQHVVYDNRMVVRQRVGNHEHSNSNAQIPSVPSSAVTPSIVVTSDEAPARPPRSVDTNPRAPPLPTGRRKIGRPPHV